MVALNRIYTRTGDQGTTGLASGERRPKYDLRIEAYGTVDETNACIGLARLHTGGHAIDPMLGRIQNDLFDLGADLATPETGRPMKYEPLRIVEAQVELLEAESTWQRWAIGAIVDDLHLARAQLTERVLGSAGGEPVEETIDRFLGEREAQVTRFARLVAHLRADPVGDVAAATVAVRQLRSALL